MKKLYFVLLLSSYFTAQAQTSHVVISQLYGAGGNSGALFSHDFVELFNPTSSPVNLSGWSLQYAGATTNNWNSNKVDLSGTIEPGKYFLVQVGNGGEGTVLPKPDLVSTNITLGTAAGKVALVNTTTLLSGNCPAGSFIIDFVGYGAADCFEKATAPAASLTKAVVRLSNGCTDTDNNASDFVATTPGPRNSAAPANGCNGFTTTVSAINPMAFCITAAESANGTVSYTSVGTFSNSLFKVLLSDVNGGFATTTVVGSATNSGTNPSGTINITIPAGLASGTKYRLRVDAENPSVAGTPGSAIEIINGAVNIPSFTASPNSGHVTLNWSNPNCFDEILIVAKDGAFTTAVPTGDGNGYTGDLQFTGNGSVFDGGKVVYKGRQSGQIISGLTDGTSYSFKAFTRRGTHWSNGLVITEKPRLLPRPGEILINQISPGYSTTTDEYVELVNVTGKTFDLSELAIRYEASTGNSGVAGATLSGTLAPHGYWLLASKETVTVGKTNALPRDGYIADGFAATAGQIGLVRKTDNVVLDAVGYGSITGGSYTEGEAASSPPANGGLKRKTDGVDNNFNKTDFVTVANADIYLRNSQSRQATILNVLPVKFTHIKAIQKEGTIQIEFTNSTESDIAYYGVEKSANGQSFKEITQLAPKQNNGSAASYASVDGTPVQGVNFYRIKAVETSGKTEYSAVVKINNARYFESFTIYPNPVTNKTINWQMPLPKGNFFITVYNSSGAAVWNESLPHSGGNFSKTVYLPQHIVQGVYTLQVAGENKKWQKTFLVL